MEQAMGAQIYTFIEHIFTSLSFSLSLSLSFSLSLSTYLYLPIHLPFRFSLQDKIFEMENAMAAQISTAMEHNTVETQKNSVKKNQKAGLLTKLNGISANMESHMKTFTGRVDDTAYTKEVKELNEVNVANECVNKCFR